MAFMQVELFSQALHMAVGVDLILPQPVKNEIGMESGEKTEKNIQRYGCYMEQRMIRLPGKEEHPLKDMLLPWESLL